MMEALENEVRRSRRLEHTFAVLIADVDHFKQYNDAHGHPAGDEALIRLGAALCEAARDVDFVARYGGEEFFVLMPETNALSAAPSRAAIVYGWPRHALHRRGRIPGERRFRRSADRRRRHGALRGEARRTRSRGGRARHRAR
jgi:GGDEF domain-containing protein